jgi:predicted component of type VI protein secretion system
LYWDCEIQDEASEPSPAAREEEAATGQTQFAVEKEQDEEAEDESNSTQGSMSSRFSKNTSDVEPEQESRASRELASTLNKEIQTFPVLTRSLGGYYYFRQGITGNDS